MSKSQNGSERVVFYLYDYSNNLVKKPKKIYSPYNVKTLGRTPSEDYFNDPDSVEFKDGQYVADIEKLGKQRFEQQVEWLGFYNTRGGQLSKGGTGQKHINGRFYRNDGIHTVKLELVDTGPKAEIEIQTEVVEKQQIPQSIAVLMDVKQLRELAAEWQVELSEDILSSGDSKAIKATIIETMTQSGHISK